MTRRPGERFGAWTLVERVTGRGWLCRCCGTELVRWTSSITSGRSRSCGNPARHPEVRRGKPPRKADPSYRAMHHRLQVDRGPASARTCVDCGDPARDWSYDGRDPDERRSRRGSPYSLHADHYVPRCRPCHQTHDRRKANA